MIKKLIISGVIAFGVLLTQPSVGDEIQVQAATKLPDNHEIEQLKVEWTGKNSYHMHVGDRKGTLLIRVDQPKKEWNIEWVNWRISKPLAVNFHMHSELDQEKQPYIAPLNFRPDYGYDFAKQGEVDSLAKKNGRIRNGLMQFSDFSDPDYYLGLAIYLPENYSKDGVYWFGGIGSALREDGQVKAYFYPDSYVVPEAIEKVKKDGTFPLLNKVMWGKTELWQSQLGKVTVKHPTTLWKRLDNGKLEKVRDLKAGDEYRVYKFLNEKKGLYGVGANMYVERDSSKVLYETPSKRNLRLVRIMHGQE